MSVNEEELARWCKTLEMHAHFGAEEIPSGFFTAFELAKKTKRSLTNTRHRLAELLADKKAVRKKFRVCPKGKHARSILHFKLLD